MTTGKKLNNLQTCQNLLCSSVFLQSHAEASCCSRGISGVGSRIYACFKARQSRTFRSEWFHPKENCMRNAIAFVYDMSG